MPETSPKFREFIKKYRIEFVIAAIAVILCFEIAFALNGHGIIEFIKDGWGIRGYNILIIALTIMLIFTALISYPRIYKFKVLLSATALAGYMIMFTMITNIFPVKISFMDFRLDFYEPAWRDAGRFSNTFLITMLNVNFLAVMLANSSVNFNKGKKIALWGFFGSMALYITVLFLIEGNYFTPVNRASQTAIVKLAGDAVDLFNRYVIPLNLLIFIGMAAVSVFNIDEEHNYGSIIMGVATLNFYSLLILPYEHGYWKLKIIIPFMAVILIVGVFIHWISCLHHKAHYDPLLKIYNRQHMDDILSGVTDINLGEHFSVFMCDIDHFKNVNDTYGHAAGDAVLFRTAQIIRDTALPEGVVCRYGGEEIFVFLRDKNREESVLKAEKIRKAVKKEEIRVKDRTIKVTMSIGVAYTGKGIEDIQNMIKKSDDNVYKAKERGRDMVVAE